MCPVLRTPTDVLDFVLVEVEIEDGIIWNHAELSMYCFGITGSTFCLTSALVLCVARQANKPLIF